MIYNALRGLGFRHVWRQEDHVSNTPGLLPLTSNPSTLGGVPVQATVGQTHTPAAATVDLRGPTLSPTGRPTLFGLPLERGIVIVDAVAIGFTVLLSLAIRFGSNYPLNDPAQLFITAALVVSWLVILWLRQSRNPSVLGAGLEEYRRVITACALAVAATAASAYFVSDASSRHRYLILSAAVGAVSLLMGRWLVRRAIVRQVNQGSPLTRVFVVAHDPHSEAISDQIDLSEGRLEVAGFMVNKDCRPNPHEVLAAAEACGADTIVLGPDMAEDPQWTRRLCWAMESSDLSLMVSPAITSVAGPRLSMEAVQGLTLVRIDMPRFDGPTRVVKRGLDLVLSTLGLLLLALPLLLVALAIRLDTRGPALFKQQRAGRGGTSFECWKFRTMVVDADNLRSELRDKQGDAGAIFKLERDPRITRLGRVLRRTSLDELPQLVNVLRGQMSLVGPRPHPFDDVDRYDDVATRRLLAKPGMTGLWQISGRSDLDWESSVMLDLNYVENWSLSFDLAILMKTFAVVVRGTGAY